MKKPTLVKPAAAPDTRPPGQARKSGAARPIGTRAEPLRLEAERRWAESDQKASRKAGRFKR